MFFSNKDPSDIKFEFIFSGVVLRVEVKGSSVGNIEDRSEDNFSFSIEVNPVERRVGLMGETFVKINVIFFINFFFISKPQSFVSIDLFPLKNSFFYFFGSFLFTLLFNFKLLIRLLFFFLSIYLNFFLFLEINWEINEFWVLLNQVLDSSLAQKFTGIFLQINSDLGSSAQSFTIILLYLKWRSCFGCPSILFIRVTLWDHNHLRACQESWIEANTELTNKIDIALGEWGDEVCCSSFGDSTQILNKLFLGHANTSISNSNIIFWFIYSHPNF